LIGEFQYVDGYVPGTQTCAPSRTPTVQPSNLPSKSPSTSPSTSPTVIPSLAPSVQPSKNPTFPNAEANAGDDGSSTGIILGILIPILLIACAGVLYYIYYYYLRDDDPMKTHVDTGPSALTTIGAENTKSRTYTHDTINSRDSLAHEHPATVPGTDKRSPRDNDNNNDTEETIDDASPVSLLATPDMDMESEWAKSPSSASTADEGGADIDLVPVVPRKSMAADME